MVGRKTIRAIAVGTLGAAFWGFCNPRVALSEPRAWNPAEAAALAAKLADEADTFHEQVRKQPADGSLLPLSKDEWDLVELRARHLDERARSLAEKLAAGQGREETRAANDNVETTLRDVAEHSRSEWVTQDMYRTWARLRHIHLELADYYGDHDVDPRLEDIRVEPPR